MNHRRWYVVAASGLWLCATIVVGMMRVAVGQAQAPAPERIELPAAIAVPADAATAFEGDVHQAAGLTCNSCHGAGTPRALGLGALGIVLLPFLDPNTARSRVIVNWLASGAVVFMLVMTVWALVGG